MFDYYSFTVYHDGFKSTPSKERIIKSSQTSSTQAIHAAGSSSYGRANKKNWTEDRMKPALKAISLKGISVRQAADKYDIPESTLQTVFWGKHFLSHLAVHIDTYQMMKNVSWSLF